MRNHGVAYRKRTMYSSVRYLHDDQSSIVYRVKVKPQTTTITDY